MFGIQSWSICRFLRLSTLSFQQSKRRKLWFILLSQFWPLLPRITRGRLGSKLFWDFLFISDNCKYSLVCYFVSQHVAIIYRRYPTFYLWRNTLNCKEIMSLIIDYYHQAGNVQSISRVVERFKFLKIKTK